MSKSPPEKLKGRWWSIGGKGSRPRRAAYNPWFPLFNETASPNSFRVDNVKGKIKGLYEASKGKRIARGPMLIPSLQGA